MKTLQQIGIDIGALVTQKNAAYGDSFRQAGNALRLLYPDGIAPEQLDDALLIARIWDKLKRIATDRDALGESPYQDIAGYGILGVHLHSTTNHRAEKNDPCPGSASDQIAEKTSKATPDSAALSTSAKTTTNASVRLALDPSPRPVSSSVRCRVVPVPTAEGSANANVAVHVRKTRNGIFLCANPNCMMRLDTPVFVFASGLKYCQQLCADTDLMEALV
jgi:hypothetical protein